MSDRARELLTVLETAELLRLARGTLDNWRSAGSGPPHLRVGSRVLYEREAVLAWARSQARTSTTTEAAAR